MPKIIIHRKNDWFIRSRVFEIYMNGQRIGYISNGETKEFEVTVGQHKLKIKMGRFGSKDYNYTIYSKEIKLFTISRDKVRSNVILILMIIAAIVQSILTMRFRSPHITTFFFTAFLTLLVIYYQTIGRYTYLIIKESK